MKQQALENQNPLAREASEGATNAPGGVFIREAIARVSSARNLSEDEAKLVMSEIMDGVATQSQIAALLTALKMKGETVEEIAAFAMIMRERSTRISPRVKSRLVDTCGTGGDALKTLNISTIAALVISGVGTPVAKHGNRSVTSKCGSADLLEEFGVNIYAKPQTVQASIEQVGIGFMLAPIFHPAMKNASGPRKEIGIRTVFNILGPLTNPANAKTQLIGVYDDSLVLKMAQVLKRLGVEEVITVHGLDGLDEISIIGKSHVARLKDGEIHEEILTPSSFGLAQKEYGEISAPNSTQERVLVALKILSNRKAMSPSERAVRDMVMMNAAAGLLVSGKVSDYREGVELAKQSLESGKALDKLGSLVAHSGGDTAKLGSLLLRLA